MPGTRPSSLSCCSSWQSGWPAIPAASAPPWNSSWVTPHTTSASCARTWTGSPSCPAPTTAGPRSATARQSEEMTMASPLRGPKSTEGGGFAAAHIPARRAGYGAAPPASRVLRIALHATALRAARDPGDHCGPLGQEERHAQACPRTTRRATRRGEAPGRREPVNWRSIVTRNGKITNLGRCQGSTQRGRSVKDQVRLGNWPAGQLSCAVLATQTG